MLDDFTDLDPDLDEPESSGTSNKPHWVKLAEQAERCPCNSCKERESCLVECQRFKRYTVTGK